MLMQCYCGARAKSASSKPREKLEGQALDKQHCRGQSWSPDEQEYVFAECVRLQSIWNLAFFITAESCASRDAKALNGGGVLPGVCLLWSLHLPLLVHLGTTKENQWETRPRAAIRLVATGWCGPSPPTLTWFENHIRSPAAQLPSECSSGALVGRPATQVDRVARSLDPG